MAQIPNGRTEDEQKLVLAKRQFEKLMHQFHQFLEDKILPENKTQGQLRVETDFLLRLLNAANQLDVLNVLNGPEGTFGLITLLIRVGFFMRDQHNTMDHQVKLLKNEIEGLRRQITDLSRAGQRNG